MNPLKEPALQIRDAFLAMPLPSRVIAGMLVAAIAIGLGVLMQGGSTSEETYLFGGESFNESEVAEMELAFSAAGLSQWQREGRRIKVPSDSLHTFLKALDESGKVPTRLASAMEDALNSSNPLELNGQRISRETWAKQKMIARQICVFPEVRSAAVHYDKTERGFRRDGVQTASVMVTPEGSRPLSPTTVRKIRAMVASAYAGMREEDVTVTDINGRSGDGWSEQENELLTIQRAVEEDYEREIRKLLGGYEPFTVAVHADIDPTLGTETTEVKYDTERATLQERSVKRETTNVKPAAGGVPGVEPNIGNQPARIDDTAQKSSTKDEERETSGVVGQQYTRSQLAGYQTRRVQVSIMLPQSYYDKVWRIGYLKQNPTAAPNDIPVPPADELTKLRTEVQQTIKSVVTQQLPRLETGGNDPTSLVEVGDYPDLPEPLVPGPSASERAISWLAGSWQAIGLGCLALAALLIARSVARTTPAATPPQFEEGFGLEIPASPSGEQDDAAEGGAKTAKKRMQITGGSLKDELADLIDSNPDVAANVLRSWIGDAA